MYTRKSIKLKRKSITVYSSKGMSCGGWGHFAKPKNSVKPTGIKLRPTQRVLYCPYCADWTVYQRLSDDQSTWKCTGWCGWANTNDFFVKKENDLFGGGLSSGRRRKVPKK